MQLQFETLDPGDNAHPIWQFFDNIALDNSTANEENVGSARCKDCLGLFPFPETDVEPLEEHMRSEHRANLDSYENLCEGNLANHTSKHFVTLNRCLNFRISS